MIKLKNIKKNKNVIECDAYIENSHNPVHLEYSMIENDFLPFSYPEGYEWCTSHIAKARSFLEKNTDNLPKERTIMWY